MELHVQLSQAVAALAALRAACEPSAVGAWAPSAEERALYIARCEQIIAAVDRLQIHEARQVFSQGQVQAYVPGPLLRDIRETVIPVEADIWVALEQLDPENQAVREFLFAPIFPPSGKKLLATFSQGISEVHSLIERNPGEGLEEVFLPDEAEEILESRLIHFDPDAWKERALTLAPVRVGRVNLVLPGHLRLRLEEIYRTYVFGCWISVISLSRSAIEYALLDNASRLGIETHWPADRDGRVRNKRLSDLIDDFAQAIPEVSQDLSHLRELGNAYLHPKASRTSRRGLDNRQADAASALHTLALVLEAVYVHGRAAE